MEPTAPSWKEARNAPRLIADVRRTLRLPDLGPNARYLLSALIVGGSVLLLLVFARFSLVSSVRNRGSRSRLRTPDLEGVERECGFALPRELAQIYRDAPFIERLEFELVDTSRDPPPRWPIGRFNPLTAADVREWRSISGVPGVPIADDMDKGVYFVNEAGAVLLASPNVAGRRLRVAATLQAFSTFEARAIGRGDA
jgi:hypothetical protein